MASYTQNDEFQTPVENEEVDVSPEAAALKQSAMSNAYVGSDQLRKKIDTTESNNISSRLRSKDAQPKMQGGPNVGFDNQAKKEKIIDFTPLEEEEHLMYMNPSTTLTKAERLKQVKDVVMQSNIQNILRKRQNAILRREEVYAQQKAEKKQTAAEYEKASREKTEMQNKDRTTRRIIREENNEYKYDDSSSFAEMTTNSNTSLESEILPVGRQTVKLAPRRSARLQALPPGMGQTPLGVQGQENYDPDESSGYSTTNTVNNFPNRYPSNSRVYEDERKYASVERAMTRKDYFEKTEEIRFHLTGLNALGEQLINKFGGLDGYLDSIDELIRSDALPEDIVTRSLENIFGQVPTNLLDDVNQREGHTVEVLNEEAFDSMLAGTPAELREQMLNDARSFINGVSEPLNRSENSMDIPDKGGLPLSSSTGTNTDDIYNDNSGAAFNPENIGYRFRSAGGAPGGVGGGGGGGGGGSGPLDSADASFRAIQNLHKMAPHIAQMLTDNATRPLLIKRMQIKSIYPPPPKHTNLAIVQQSIANYQEDASLLNVFFT